MTQTVTHINSAGASIKPFTCPTSHPVGQSNTKACKACLLACCQCRPRSVCRRLTKIHTLLVASKYLVRLLIFFEGSKNMRPRCPWLWFKLLSSHLNHWIDLCNRQWLCRIDGGYKSGKDASAEHARAKPIWRCFRHSWDHRKKTATWYVCQVSLARPKRPPIRFSWPAEAYQPTDVGEYFRAEYVKMI